MAAQRSAVQQTSGFGFESRSAGHQLDLLSATLINTQLFASSQLG